MASTVNFVIRWSATARVPGWEAIVWIVLAGVSVFVLYVGARTVVATVLRSRA